eukprot:13740049-Alexandrium_andersonii.AAC.1
MAALMAPQPRVYYMQDHVEIEVHKLEQSVVEGLILAKAEKEEEQEQRTIKQMRAPNNNGLEPVQEETDMQDVAV